MSPSLDRRESKASKVTPGLTGRTAGTVQMAEMEHRAETDRQAPLDPQALADLRAEMAETAWLGRKEWMAETEWTERLDEMGLRVGQPR